MPRPREFDEASALNAAMECFWRRGYEATSLRDLTGAMGLTAPSIYNAFGDKQQLFGRAFEQYLEHTTRERLRRLQEELPPKEAIRRFFAEIVDHSINDRQRKGCFLVNSALEVAPHDAKSRAVIAAQFGNIEAFFRQCILAGQADKTISRRHRSQRGGAAVARAYCLASASSRELCHSVRTLKGPRGPRSRCWTNLIITTKESGDD